VLAVSEGRYEHGQLVPLSVEVGDEVLYDKFGGSEMPGLPEDIVVLREKDIVAKR
jgi:chaperonin GroES